ncbi:unnamed protein product, partial [Hapterophycus canaliculatus]
METRCPPGLYLDPPDFDIELEDFARLPLCRLEAFRLLREGQANNVSGATSERKASTADARLLLLHGHGDRPSEAKHRRADLSSHFILKLACCGGSASSSSGGGGGGGGGGVADGGFSGTNSDKDRGEEEADRRRSRREWFVRAERDLFEARLHWHLRQTEGAQGQRQRGTGARGAGEHGGAGAAAAAVHSKHEMPADASRSEALRIVYNLGWLRPVAPVAAGRDGEARTVRGERERTFAGGEADCRRRSVGVGGGGGGGAAGKRRPDGDDPFEEENPTFSPSRPPPPASAAQDGSGTIVRYTSCPFVKALPLVRSRRVLLREGRALLSPAQVPQVVVGHFEGLLREGIAVAARGLPAAEADERVAGVLREVRRAVDASVRGDGGSGGGGDGERSAVAITRRNIDEVAAKHFPLCMRRALRVLRREHHLKYQGRMQLISFLGNAGMEARVGELLGLWREEFPKGMAADEYARKRNHLNKIYGRASSRPSDTNTAFDTCTALRASARRTAPSPARASPPSAEEARAKVATATAARSTLTQSCRVAAAAAA